MVRNVHKLLKIMITVVVAIVLSVLMSVLIGEVYVWLYLCRSGCRGRVDLENDYGFAFDWILVFLTSFAVLLPIVGMAFFRWLTAYFLNKN